MQLSDGKWGVPTLKAANSDGPRTSRLFVNDRVTKIEFLVDTGSDLCVQPRTCIKGRTDRSTYEMYAANGTTIGTYGIKTLRLDLGLRRAFTWKFIIADVAKPIIGADLLNHLELFVNLRQLLDTTTSLISTGRIVVGEPDSVRTIVSDSPYHQLLAKYPDFTRPAAIPHKVKHDVVHHINTTPGPPIHCRPRRLSADMYKIANTEFSELISQPRMRHAANRSSHVHSAPPPNAATWSFQHNPALGNPTFVKDTRTELRTESSPQQHHPPSTPS